MKSRILKVKCGSEDKPLKIGSIEIQCYVLENGKRVLSGSGMAKSLDLSLGGSSKLSNFIARKSISPYINEAVSQAISLPIKFTPPHGGIAYGYEATILADICDSILQARKAGVLTSGQLRIAEQCEILVRGFAKVGIIALVDEVTGYIDPDKNALQKILDKYLTDEWSKWTKRFPDEFYKEIFRLKGIPFPPKSGKKSSYVGHWTNDVVYSRLAPGLLDELKKKNPILNSGHRARRHHQHLTDDFGSPKLNEYLSQIIFLMKTCSNWREFHGRLARVAPKLHETMLLPME